jgi:hypothetical protein
MSTHGTTPAPAITDAGHRGPGTARSPRLSSMRARLTGRVRRRRPPRAVHGSTRPVAPYARTPFVQCRL